MRDFGTRVSGDRVAHYEILDKLGAGGMGVVYKALDTKLGRQVALKFLPENLSSDANRKERFLQEARAAAALDHVNVGTVYGIEETAEGQMFIVMAYYGGCPLSDVLHERRLGVEEAISIGRQIALGLAAAHSQGIVHRDIKPSNVIVTPGGLAKIVDFGLARFVDAKHLTEAGATIGTAAYMSPEQARGNEVDQRTDIWSLGVVLCEMLTGRLPFQGERVHALLYNVVHDSPAIDGSGIPAPCVAVVEKALSKDLDSRYARAEDVAADLSATKSGQTPNLTTQTLMSVGEIPGFSAGTAKTGAPSRRRPILLWSAAALFCAVVGAALIPAWRNGAMQWFRQRGAADSAKHIVLIPFRSIGNDPANNELCDGLTEMLTSRLTSLEGNVASLWVIPPGEVRRKKVSSPQEAQKEFGANLAISGSLQKSGNNVQLALNLVDPKTLRLLGSRIVRVPDGDLAALEDDAVKKIAELLALDVHTDTGQSRAASTAISAAYESYVRAKGLLRGSNKPENVEGALRDLNAAVQQDPRFALAYSGLAEAYWAKWAATKDPKWRDATVGNAKKALQLDGQLAPAYVVLAQAHETTLNPELAVDELQQALKLDPRNGDALRGLGRVWERLGRIADGERMFQKAISLHPEYWVGHYDYAQFLTRQGRPKEAELQYQRVIELTPDNANAYTNLGALYFSMNRNEDARKAYEKSIGITPTYAALANLATLLDNQHQEAEAARKYEQALKLNDKDYRVWANLAREYEQLSDPRARPTLEHAAAMAEAALAREPQSPVLLSQLSYYDAKLGRKDKAPELARKATLLAPNDTQSLLRTARTFELVGRRDQALENVAAALKNSAPPDTVFKGKSDSEEMKGLVADPRYIDMIAKAKSAARTVTAKSK